MKKVTIDVGLSSVARFRFNFGACGGAPGTANCRDSVFCSYTMLLSEQHGSVHIASIKEAEQHVRQARTAENGRLRRWHLWQAHRHVASMCMYQARLWAPPIVVDACCGTGTSVVLFHLKYTQAIVVGIDRDKSEEYVRSFIPKKFQSRFFYIKDDVCSISVAWLPVKCCLLGAAYLILFIFIVRRHVKA